MIRLGRQNGDEICNPSIDYEVIFTELNTFDNLCYLFAKKSDGSVVPLEKIPFPNSFGFEQQTNIDFFTEGRLIYGIGNKVEEEDNKTYYNVSGSELINLPYYAEGLSLLIKFKQTNIGKAFICINNISFKEVVKTTNESLSGGELKVDGIYLVAYDGERFQLVNYLGQSGDFINSDVLVVTYDELRTLALTNKLLTGAEYLIKDYRTRSEIPYSQVQQDLVYIPEIYEHYYDGNKPEPLIVKAVSSNKIHHEAKSSLFWQDQIHYDLLNNENGSDRGKIYFRRDTINDLETGYDFRGIKFRRWLDYCDKPYHFLPTWQYTFEDIDFQQGVELVSLVISINGVMSEIEFNEDLPKNDQDLAKFTVLEYIVKLLSENIEINKWFDVFLINNIIYFRNKINWEWNKYVLDVNYFNLKVNKVSQPTNRKLHPMASETERYCDLFTFTGIVKNIHIKPIDTFISNNYKWFYSNNIILSDEVGVSIRNVRMGYNSINNTILSGSHEINMNDFTSHNLLKRGNEWISLADNSYLNWFEEYSANNSIEFGSYYNFIMETASHNKIGAHSSWNFIERGVDYNSIGSNSHRNFYTEYIKWNEIGDNSSDNFLGHQSIWNKIGNSCNDNWLDDYCSYNILEDNSSDNLLGRYVSNNKFGINCNNNKLGDESINNIIGRDSINNIIGMKAIDNIFGNYFIHNTIGIEANGNKIGNNATFNVIKNRMRNNDIGNYFEYNNIGNDFRENVWGDFGKENIIGNDAEMNKVGDKCYKNIIGHQFWRNVWGDNCICNEVYGCHQDNFIMGGAQYNFYGPQFTNNELGYGAVHNHFMEDAIFNVLGSDFGSNTCTARFQNNRIGARCQGNIFGMDFKNNRVGNEFNENIIGHDSNNNQIGDQMYQCVTMSAFDFNEIGDRFKWVYIEEGVCYNKIGHGFEGLSIAVPSRIGRYFRHNIIYDNAKRLIFPMYFQYNRMLIPNINNYVDTSFLEISAGLNDDPIRKKIVDWNKSIFEIWVDYTSVHINTFDINPYRDWGGIFNFVNNTNDQHPYIYRLKSINVMTTPYLNEDDEGVVTWEIELRPMGDTRIIINGDVGFPHQLTNIVLLNGTEELELNGDNHEWIRLQQRNGIWYEISRGLYQ